MINQQSPQPAVQEPVPASASAPFIIRPQLDADIAAIVALSLRAWQPVYESMARVLGPRLNRLVYPVKLVQLGTGGDPGHAPARHTYEKAGFTPLPLVRYYKELPAVRED